MKMCDLEPDILPNQFIVIGMVTVILDLCN